MQNEYSFYFFPCLVVNLIFLNELGAKAREQECDYDIARIQLEALEG
jgi:hypothetical protein